MTSINPDPQLVDGVDVDLVAEAVQACPGVHALDAGPYASITSYLPLRRVPGVRVDEEIVTVGVRVAWGTAIPALGRSIQTQLTPLIGGRRVDVIVVDLAGVPGSDDEVGEADEWLDKDRTPSNATAPRRGAPSSAPITPTAGEIPRSS